MTQQLNPLLIATQHINSQLPADALIGTEADGRYYWNFRGVTSTSLKGAEDGFKMPLDALCNFVNFLIEEADTMVELLRNADAPEYWVPDEDN